MNLIDIFDLKKEVQQLHSAQEVIDLLDENSEDAALDEAEQILTAAQTDQFVIREDTAFLRNKKIGCISCKNSLAGMILSNACEVLTADEQTHFGCCECGETFSLTDLG